jgi:group I intron endonuclease
MLVYLIKNNINGKQYVGQTKQNPTEYWKHCIRRALAGSKSKPALYAAIRKHGIKSFQFEPLVIVESKQELDYYERELIKSLGLRNRNNGYNCTDGGEGIHGFQHSEGTKEKMRFAALGNKCGLGHKVSEEHREKLKGNQHASGYKHTEEAKARISQSLVGNKRAKSVISV